MSKIRIMAFFSIFVFLVSCGGAKKALLSPSDIAGAQKNGTLNVLYNEMADTVNQSSGSTKKEASALKSQIAKLLVGEKVSAVNEMLGRQKSNPSSVSRASLLALQQSISEMSRWSQADYAKVSPKVSQAIERVNKKIELAMVSSQKTDVSSVEKVLALEKAAELAGQGQPEEKQYVEAYDNLRGALLVQGNKALNNRRYDEVFKAAREGLKIEPESVQFNSMLSQGQSGLFETDFRQAIENGKPETAYQSLLAVVDKPMFKQIKKSMYSSIYVLANYFANSAQKFYKKGQLNAAYIALLKGRDVQAKLGVQQGFIQEKAFLDKLMLKAKKAGDKHGQKFALLRTIQELDANYPSLAKELTHSRTLVKKRALTKLFIAEFKEIGSQSSAVSSMGRRMAKKLEKILFSNLGNEVVVVTSLSPPSAKSYDGLSLKVEGEVLQAAVESSSNSGRRLKLVQTSVNRVETEDYQDWSKGKNGPAPKQYHETPVKEQVELIVEHIQKQAVAEVFFRLIESGNDTILVADNIVKESQFKGESIQEFQKGDFHQPYISADLPSDIKALDRLSSALAAQMGEKLGRYLKSPEQIFSQKFKEAKARGQKAVAVELLANAVVLGESQPDARPIGLEAWYEALKSMALEQVK